MATKFDGEFPYAAVNAAWPPGTPAITFAEAAVAARKLTKHFGGRRALVGRVRRCWISRKPTDDLARGWRRLVHDVSHRVWRREAPAAKAHSKHHALLELEMIQYVVAKGWLTGPLAEVRPRRLRPTAESRLAKAQADLARWQRKLKLAQTKVKVYTRRLRVVERRAAKLAQGVAA